MFKRKVYIISITVYSYAGEDYTTTTEISRVYRKLKPAIDYSSNLVKRVSNGYATTQAFVSSDTTLNQFLASCKTQAEHGCNYKGHIYREYQYFEPIPDTIVETRLKVSIQLTSFRLY